MKKITKLLLSILTIISISCKKEEKDPLIIPTVYDSTGYAVNVVATTTIRTKLAALATYMKKGDNVANKLNIDSLNYYFSGTGIPTLKSYIPAYYSNLIEDTWFSNLVTNSQNNFDITTATTATVGGVYSNRLLDNRGKETLQEIDKGLYASLLYNYFITLSQSATMTAATVDNMLCIYGAHPTFPNTNTIANTNYPDAFIALYAARRDRVTVSSGLYRQIKTEFITLKAAVNAGSNYTQEKNEAIANLKLLQEKALMATVINYVNSAKTKLNVASPPVSDKAGAIHDLSECVGFVHGFKAVATTQRKITDAQISDILESLKSPLVGSTTMYEFANTPSATIISLEDLMNYIQAIYGFTQTEMDGFNYNWITTEGR